MQRTITIEDNWISVLARIPGRPLSLASTSITELDPQDIKAIKRLAAPGSDIRQSVISWAQSRLPKPLSIVDVQATIGETELEWSNPDSDRIFDKLQYHNDLENESEMMH